MAAAAVYRSASIPIAGGNRIDSVQALYGLVALGLVHPKRVERNAVARAGDLLVLGKPMGVGVMSAAPKQGELGEAGCAQMIASTTRRNTPRPDLAELPGVKALAAHGFVTGASGHNWAGCGAEVLQPDGFAAEDRALLTDPPTRGGLLAACGPAALDTLLAVSGQHGFDAAALVGRIAAVNDVPRLA